MLGLTRFLGFCVVVGGLTLYGCGSANISNPLDTANAPVDTASTPIDVSSAIDATSDPVDLSPPMDTAVDMSGGGDLAQDVIEDVLAIDACLLTELDGEVTCISEMSLDWGVIEPGTSTSGSVQLTNVGNLDAELISVSWSQGGESVEHELLTFSVLSAGDDAGELPVVVESGGALAVQIQMAAGFEPGALPVDALTLVLAADNGEEEVVVLSLAGSIADCALGIANCDDDWSNGCEVDTLTSSEHCGSCASVCSVSNGTVACEEGACVSSCDEGWEGSSCETNIDECSGETSPCGANAACTDSDGSFSCACNEGYAGDGLSCANVDECLDNPCDANAACTDSEGSFSCACNTGFTGDGLSCTNVNECVVSSPCHPNASCTDTPGSFVCACNGGFSGNGVQCTNVNECLSNPCGTNSVCTDTPGSYNCDCLAGFVPSGFNCVPPSIISTKTLSFGGVAGASWFHTASLYNNGAVVVNTNWSLSVLIPSSGTLVATNIASGGCVNRSFSGTINLPGSPQDGNPFTSTVTYCRSGNSITISHTAGGPVQTHGTMNL